MRCDGGAARADARAADLRRRLRPCRAGSALLSRRLGSGSGAPHGASLRLLRADAAVTGRNRRQPVPAAACGPSSPLPASPWHPAGGAATGVASPLLTGDARSDPAAPLGRPPALTCADERVRVADRPRPPCAPVQEAATDAAGRAIPSPVHERRRRRARLSPAARADRPRRAGPSRWRRRARGRRSARGPSRGAAGSGRRGRPERARRARAGCGAALECAARGGAGGRAGRPKGSRRHAEGRRGGSLATVRAPSGARVPWCALARGEGPASPRRAFGMRGGAFCFFLCSSWHAGRAPRQLP